MADTPSRDPFRSGTESESEAEGQDRARTERRAKREAAKLVEFVGETILDEEDDPMDDDTDVKECEDRLRRIQTGSSSTEAAAEESPPIVVNKKSIHVLKSRLSADPSGADSRMPPVLKKKLPLNLDDSAKVKVKTADHSGAVNVVDPSGATKAKNSFDSAYHSVRSLRKNLKSNMSLRGGGGLLKLKKFLWGASGLKMTIGWAKVIPGFWLIRSRTLRSASIRFP